MHNASFIVGDIVAPIIFMLFLGYHIGQHSGKMVLSVVIALMLGFITSLWNVWKAMKKLRARK